MSSVAWGLLLLLSFIWGASFYFIEVGLGYLDPYWLVSLRLVTGAIALTAWLVLTGNMPVPNFSYIADPFFMDSRCGDGGAE